MKAPDWSAYDRYIADIERLRAELDAVLAEYAFGITDYAAIDRLARLLDMRVHAATVEVNSITAALSPECER